ncbi:MAG: alkylhydroperoxidase AhpD family core domain protein [Sulfobacillus benefaciens]|uniref:Alkylhydroperoxidase AhpD family core domain protein n=1 Tax=Sulfobacillus benefaciens TaxID=453960 RepID=A0A2T2XEE4_9FIRM|nr:MAG: alkylhydroperoxidase AhpD family core domain protein [Sulfobacillus benefaciens]
MDPKMKELVAVAASVASGCTSCLETHMRLARQAGADSRDIQTVVNIARAVRLQGIATIDDLAGKWAQGEPIAVIAGGESCGPGCNC